MFYADQPIQAHKLFKSLQAEHPDSTQVTDFAKSELMQILDNDIAILSDFLASSENAYSDWTKVHDKTDYKLYYRYVEG